MQSQVSTFSTARRSAGIPPHAPAAATASDGRHTTREKKTDGRAGNSLPVNHLCARVVAAAEARLRPDPRRQTTHLPSLPSLPPVPASHSSSRAGDSLTPYLSFQSLLLFLLLAPSDIFGWTRWTKGPLSLSLSSGPLTIRTSRSNRRS